MLCVLPDSWRAAVTVQQGAFLMAEEKLTRDEWRQREIADECARDKHAPSRRIATWADPVGFFLCDCGAVRWQQHQGASEEDVASSTPPDGDADAAPCPQCRHVHDDGDCDCGCEWDTAFCGRCGWLDCECPE